MKDLLYAIAAGLVEDKSAISITEDAPDEEGVIVFHLTVAPMIWDELSVSRAELPRLCVLSCAQAQLKKTSRSLLLSNDCQKQSFLFCGYKKVPLE